MKDISGDVRRGLLKEWEVGDDDNGDDDEVVDCCWEVGDDREFGVFLGDMELSSLRVSIFAMASCRCLRR